jgi:hypothetical protein
VTAVELAMKLVSFQVCFPPEIQEAYKSMTSSASS